MVDMEGMVRVLRRSREYVDELNGDKVVGSVGKVVYVAVDGSDEEGDGSEGRPFATPNRAIRALGRICNGCKVVLKAGTYNIMKGGSEDGVDAAINLDGIVGNLVVEGERADSVPVINTDHNYAIYSSGCSVTFRNMYINYNGSNSGRIVYVIGGYVEIKNGMTIMVCNNRLTNVFVACCGGVLRIGGDGSTPSLGFVESNTGNYVVAWAFFSGIITMNSINILTGDGLMMPQTGNYVDYGGMIFVAPGLKYNATNAEDKLGSLSGMIIRKSFKYPTE